MVFESQNRRAILVVLKLEEKKKTENKYKRTHKDERKDPWMHVLFAFLDSVSII